MDRSARHGVLVGLVLALAMVGALVAPASANPSAKTATQLGGSALAGASVFTAADPPKRCKKAQTRCFYTGTNKKTKKLRWSLKNDKLGWTEPHSLTKKFKKKLRKAALRACYIYPCRQPRPSGNGRMTDTQARAAALTPVASASRWTYGTWDDFKEWFKTRQRCEMRSSVFPIGDDKEFWPASCTDSIKPFKKPAKVVLSCGGTGVASFVGTAGVQVLRGVAVLSVATPAGAATGLTCGATAAFKWVF